MTAYGILKKGFDKKIADAIVNAYKEIEQNYVLQKWKPSELDAGHFVEAVRRAIDLELTGKYVPVGKSLPRFNDQALTRYEQQAGNESFRMLIPRTLKAIYNVRNKRGVAHISDVNPNEMDASFILGSVKWVLAELVRLKSGLTIPQTQDLLDAIIERHCPLIWKESGIVAITRPKMKAKDQVLVLLYDSSPIRDTELQRMIEYNNKSNFIKILKGLHRARNIYYHADGNCRIMPPGLQEAETLIKMNT
jgi:hypothetical protein